MTPCPPRGPGAKLGVLVVLVLVLVASGCVATDLGPAPDAAAPTSAGVTKKPAGQPAHPRTSAASSQGAAGGRKGQPSPDPHIGGTGTAAAQLATLRVAGRAPMTGYYRDRYGQAWLDADRNGCDTRNDVLRRDLHPITVKVGTNGCVVLTGTLADPYTGTRIEFVHAVTDSVDIDHVVALGNAWVSGAWKFDIRKRAALANDPVNLLAVDASSNRQKGDADAASWLPSNKAYRCAYVARQIAVKAKYHLTVTAAERGRIAAQLARCPGRVATPDVTHAPRHIDQNLNDPGSPRPSTSAPTKGGSSQRGGGAVYYQNCDAARAASAAPLHRGDPGYDVHLDRDGDGSACED